MMSSGMSPARKNGVIRLSIPTIAPGTQPIFLIDHRILENSTYTSRGSSNAIPVPGRITERVPTMMTTAPPANNQYLQPTDDERRR